MRSRFAIIVVSLIYLVWFFIANLVADLVFSLITGKDPAFAMFDDVGTKQLVGTVGLVGTGVSIILAIILAIFVFKDCKENTGRKPWLNALLAVLLGFIWGFIYLILTLNQQGKVSNQVKSAP